MRGPGPSCLAIFALCFCLANPAAADLVELTPGRVVEGHLSPKAGASPDGGVELRLPFGSVPDRVFWDFSVRRLPPDATAIIVELTCPDPAAIRGISLHLRRGEEWMSTAVAPEGSDRRTLFFQRSAFVSEGSGNFWQDATGIRISFWKGAARNTSATLHAIRAWTHSVAILQGSEHTAPGETALAAACAARARRLLDQAGIPAAILEDKLGASDLRRYELLVLPYNPNLPDEFLDRMERFVLGQGGRLVVFYQSNQRLASLLGMTTRPYASQSEPWTSVSFDAESVPGMPSTLPHRTQHLLPVRGEAPDAFTLGHWNTPDGISDRKTPASAVSPRGLWFSHVPPLAGVSAAQWLLSAMAAMDPSYAPQRDQLLQKNAGRDRQARAMLGQSPAHVSEIRAAWASPQAARARSAQAGKLAEGGVNVLFEHLATGGFAHYRTGNTVPQSELGDRRSANYVTRNAASDKVAGVELHAWIICWNLEGISAPRLDRLRSEGRLMVDSKGDSIPWMCPSHPENRQAVLDVCRDLVSRGIAGIHLDYIRYPAREVCYGPITRAAFEKSRGEPVEHWPADVLRQGSAQAGFDAFRSSEITSFVRALSAELRTLNPAIRISAAVFPTPEVAATMGQDWRSWMNEGGVDFVCPMLYTASAERFLSLLELNLAHVSDASRLVPGLGNSADESQLDALDAAVQISAARQRQLGGFAFFQADSDLTDRILPVLRLAPREDRRINGDNRRPPPVGRESP